MLARLMEWSARHVAAVVLACVALAAGGTWAMLRTPVDALPDLSDVQVILYTEFPGQGPQVVEDQVTYPLSTAMLGVPHAKLVRGFSNFGVSYVYVIFEDGTDLYWARSRVLEYLNSAASRLPPGVVPTLGPDATGVGWVYQYALRSATRPLDEQRALQDFYLRPQLARSPGVAEVASVGGFVRTYQVTVDPHRLLALGIPLREVSNAIRASNHDVGGRSVELAGTEYVIRGRGYLRGPDDIGRIVLRAPGGVPVRVADVARVETVPDERRGIAELDGTGEVVSGVVVARSGENALAVIHAAKQKLAELAAGLPEGVSVQPVYDRSGLIESAIATLRGTLLEESLVVALACFVFLLHARSALVAILMLPVGVLMAFIALRAFGMSSNIMSLGGLAIAMGAMVDAAIVMVENAHKHIERQPEGAPRLPALLAACREVGPALFFSLLVITVSFLPVFTLEAQEGRLFRPLAWTKTFAMASAALLSVTLVPALMVLFIRGRVPREQDHPLMRWLVGAYQRLLGAALRWRWAVLAGAGALLAASVLPALRLGVEFMPTLDEGTLLFMPSSLPGLPVTQAARTLQLQDRILRGFPEVASVFGKAGRAATATDPAPLEMSETVINLKPRALWRPGMTPEKLVAEMDEAVRMPGVSNAWTMPIKARLDMLATGIRTPVGVKVFGSDVQVLARIAREVEQAVRTVPGTTSAYAERLDGGWYIDIVPDPQALGRHGLSIDDVHEVVATALGAEVVTTTVEGRQRFDVTVRYPRDLRDSPERMAREVLVPVPSGAMVPLGQLATVQAVQGPPALRTENALLSAYVFVDLHGRDIGGYVAEARRVIAGRVRLPPGYYLAWSGQYEYLQHALARLKAVVPLTVLLIAGLLWLNFRSVSGTLIVMLGVPFSLVGGIWLLAALGYNLSVAVVVGFIALAGVAAETAVVMIVYLDSAWHLARARCESEGRAPGQADLQAAVLHGAAQRLRPKLMTVCAIMAGLLPILWSHGTGSEVMRRIAAPMVGGMASAAVLTLLVVPVVYLMVHAPRAAAKVPFGNDDGGSG